MKTPNISIYLFLLLLFVFQACVKEELNTEKISTSFVLDPDVATPVAYTSLSLDRYLSDSLRPEQLTVDENGLLTVMYHKNVFSYKGADLIKFPDIQEGFTLKNETNQNLIFTSDVVYTDTISIDFGFNNGDEQLDSIIVNSCILDIVAQMADGLTGEINIIIPGIVKNNIPYSKTFNLDATNRTDNLEGYTIILNDDASANSNILEVVYNLTLTNSVVQILPGVSIVEINIGFKDLDYKAVFGYIGQHNLDIEQNSFSLSLYDNIEDGSFHFENPKLNILISNSYGLPIEFEFGEFYAETKKTGIIDITGEAIPTIEHPKVMNFPTIEQYGQTVEDNIFLNHTSTNMFTVLENMPEKVSYSVNAQTNPNGQGDYNFVTDSSQYNVDVQFEMDIWGYADFLIMRDTLKFDMGDFYNQDVEEIKRLIFRLSCTNSFPINIQSQIYFTDNQYNIIDSMFTETQLVEGGIDTNGDGKTDPTKQAPVDVEFTREKIENIEIAKYIIIWGRLSTVNSDANPPESVKFYSSYKLDAYLGAIMDLELNSGN